MRTSRLLVALGFGLLAIGADWPQLLGPSRNGISTETDLIDGWKATGPTVVWQREVGAGYSSPAIVGDRLILFHRVKDEDVVECLDAGTGKERWAFRYPTNYEDDYGKGNGPRGTPVIAEGQVITLSAAGHLHCIDLKSGKKRWERKLLDEYASKKTFFGVGTTPLVEGKRVLLNVGADEAGIVAFAIETGKEVWKATSHEASYASPIAVTVNGIRHGIFFTREGLVSLDPASGTVRANKRWRSRIHASVNAATPILLGEDHLFVSASYNTGAVVVKIKKDAFEEVWKNDSSLSCHFSTPVVVGEQLYGFDGRQETGATLRCIDWKTGKVRWTEEGYGCGSVIAAGKKLFILSEGGDLVLLRATPDKYEEKARARVLSRPCRAHLALANGLLYGRDDRKLVCWKVK